MTIRLTIKNLANGTSLRMEVEPDETVNDLIVSAGEYWNLDAGSRRVRSSCPERRRSLMQDC